MKISWNNKYTTIAVYAFIVICASILLYIATSQMEAFIAKLNEIVATLRPFIIGGTIAYLLNFILVFYEDKILVKRTLSRLTGKSKRAVGLLLTYITAIIMVYLFFQFVLPQLIESIVGLANNIPQYVNETSIYINELVDKMQLEGEYLNALVTKWNELVRMVINIITNMVPMLGNVVMTITSSILNIVIGIIVSVYILIDKERYVALSKKMTFAIFNKLTADKVLELAERSNRTFGRFISGKILDSFIIGVLTFIVLTIFKMPYALLISVIIGITNIIPFFGPFFGAIPSTIIILFVSPIQALWFIGIILVIQQIDGNIIGPKILGDSIGVGAFWILFSLLIFSKLLGFVGMIIGVPIFAIIFSVIKEIVEANLAKKGLKTETEDYMN